MPHALPDRRERRADRCPAKDEAGQADVARALRDELDLVLRVSPAIIYRRECLGDPPDPFPLTYMSANVETLLGLRAADLLAPSSLYRERVAVQDRAALDATLAAAGERPVRGTYRFLDGSGAVRWLQDELHLVPGAAGCPSTIVGHLVDVTDRQAIMDELFQSEERYALAVQGSHAGLWDLDVPSSRIYLSPRLVELFGYAEDELDPHADFHTFLGSIHPDDRGRVEAALQAHLDGLAEFGIDFRARHRDGTYRWFNACGQANWVGDLRPARMAGWIADITERRRLEEELRQAQKMEAVGRLAGGVAHDFNNLLTVILGYARILSDELAVDNPLGEDAREIALAAERATGLTRQLLAFSRQQVLAPRVVNLDEIIENLQKMLRRLIGADVELQAVPCAVKPPLIRIDPGQLEQVILNLVVNARDAMPDGGRITVVTGHADDAAEACGADAGREPRVVLRVTDTGTGMDAPTQARIFEPFFTTKDKGKGTGLGLSTVYGIITQSGGRLAVDSELGRGTTFSIFFPACREEELEAARDAPGGRAQAHARGRPGGTLLLAEDEDQVRGLARGILERAGFTVIPARDGREALSLAEKRGTNLDLLVTDVVMPGMSGPQLHEALARRYPGLRVLFMSGYAESRSLPPADAPFLQKPFLPDALVARVLDLIDPLGASGLPAEARKASESP